MDDKAGSKRPGRSFSSLRAHNTYVPNEYTGADPAQGPPASSEVCPRCKGETEFRKNMVFYISNCSHKICNFCYANLFYTEEGGPGGISVSANIFNKHFVKCNEKGCNRQLNKSSYTPQTFEDISLHGKLTVRQKVLAEFGRPESFFKTVKDYDDHLEDLEDYVCNRVRGIEDKDLERRMHGYKRLKRNEVLAEKHAHKYSRELLRSEPADTDQTGAAIQPLPDFVARDLPSTALFTYNEPDFRRMLATDGAQRTSNQFYAGGCNLHLVYYKAYKALAQSY